MKLIPKLSQVIGLGILTFFFAACNAEKNETNTKSESTEASEKSSDGEIEVHAVAACPTGVVCFICDAKKRDANETAAVVGIRIPLPIFDRNQGNIQAAKERLGSARADGRATESELRSRIARLSSDLRAARSRASEFNSRTVRAARQGLDDTREAYNSGKASLLEVLDARKTLFKVERGQTRAQADLLRAHNSLKTITNN